MCLACRDYAKLRPWQLHTDTSEHYKIYQILHGYNCKIFTKEEAKESLMRVDLSDADGFLPNIKLNLNMILDEKERV